MILTPLTDLYTLMEAVVSAMSSCSGGHLIIQDAEILNFKVQLPHSVSVSGT